MKKNSLTLLDNENDDVSLTTLSIDQPLPDHEFFFQLNLHKKNTFARKKDLVKNGAYYDYYFSVFESYDPKNDITFTLINNKSYHSDQKKEITELFSTEENIAYLMPVYKKINYIGKTSSLFTDFSVILLPENLRVSTDDFLLTPEEELYQLIQYYE